MTTSNAVTRGVRVHVQSRYVPEHSRPHDRQWVFAYVIRITNEGSERVQLLTRHWIITNADGLVQEVRGDGVVGEQPVLEPGALHEYTSFCPLVTSFGTMHGSYGMITARGERFNAEIAPFALGEPHSIN